MSRQKQGDITYKFNLLWGSLLSLAFTHIAQAFTISPITPVSQHQRYYDEQSLVVTSLKLNDLGGGRSRFSLFMAEEEVKEEEKEIEESTQTAPKGLSFTDAAQAIKDEEDKERMEARGTGMEEEQKEFEAKKDAFEEMRSKIRSRASDMKMEKSVATAEAIKQATQRAMAGDAAATPTVDLSKFSGASLSDDPEDDLTDEQKKEIDKVGQLSFWEQALEEFNNTKFPTPGATIKQAGLMLLIFLVTAGIILKVDEFLRITYTDLGLIPRAGEVMDYSDLELPEGWTDQMTDDDLLKM